MAREQITVEVVQPCHECADTGGCVECQGTQQRVVVATLAPGSRSEKVQRLGEAELERVNAGKALDALVKPGGKMSMRGWDAAVRRNLDAQDAHDAAHAALRQHDTEHGRTDA